MCKGSSPDSVDWVALGYSSQAPPAAGAAPSASMRSRALADLTDDLNSLLSSGLSGLGHAHLVPGAASSSSQPQAGAVGIPYITKMLSFARATRIE